MLSISELRKIGTTQGYGPISHDNSARLQKWLRLVNVADNEQKSSIIRQRHKRNQFQQSKFVEQIKKDTARAFYTLDFYQDKPDLVEKQQQALERVLLDVFNHQLKWEYYQGFHDIAGLFLTLFNEDDAYVLTYQAAHLFFQDGMVYSFDKSIMVQIWLVMQLVQNIDPELHQAMDDIGQPPVFSVSWLLTWFVHIQSSVATNVRIFDYLLSSPPQTVIYLCSTFILHSKTHYMALLSRPDADMGTKHTFFTKLFENVPFQIEQVILDCERMQFKHPLHALHTNLPIDSNIILNNYLSKLRLENKMNRKQQQFYEGSLTDEQKIKRRRWMWMIGGQAGVLAMALHSQHNCPFFSALLVLTFYLGVNRIVRHQGMNRKGEHKVSRTTLQKLNHGCIAILLGMLLFKLR